jgi:hypothetical protein
LNAFEIGVGVMLGKLLAKRLLHGEEMQYFVFLGLWELET